jgi:hypothetical protein
MPVPHKIGAFQDKHHDLQPLKTNPDPMQTLRPLLSQDETKLAALETSALPPKADIGRDYVYR